MRVLVQLSSQGQGQTAPELSKGRSNGTRGALLLFCLYHMLRLELTHWLSAGEAEGA